MKLFDVDGPLMAALNKLADLVFANLLFILFSLPVVTLGVSLTALQTGSWPWPWRQACW